VAFHSVPSFDQPTGPDLQGRTAQPSQQKASRTPNPSATVSLAKGARAPPGKFLQIAVIQLMNRAPGGDDQL
jgi:hypothetical protein